MFYLTLLASGIGLPCVNTSRTFSAGGWVPIKNLVLLTVLADSGHLAPLRLIQVENV